MATKCDAKEKKKRKSRRAEITTSPIVCQKESKGCVFYNGAEVSSGLWGGGGCKVNTQFYKKMKEGLTGDEVWSQGVDKPVFEEARKSTR